MFAPATTQPKVKTVTEEPLDAAESLSPYDDTELLALHEVCKRESFFQRQVFEKQWVRNIFYVIGRQWIEYHARDSQWRDIKLAKWVPRPVTNKCKTIVQSIRAMFGAIQIGTNCRPNGDSPKNISVAATCDQLAPLLHQRHTMDRVMSEFDWWLIVTGNAFLYSYWDYDVRYGMVTAQVHGCPTCGYTTTEDKVSPKEPLCPECKVGVLAPTGKTERIPKGKSVSDPLSPLELAFPNSYARFDEVPYVYRLRWRPKSYFQNNPALQKEMHRITFAKAPTDRSLQIFKALSTQNDLGINPVYSEAGGSGDSEEGITEYELWYKPCDKYPDGLVVRFVGESNPIVLHLEDTEALPGPMPYVDAEGMPVFPFSHACYEHVGGRILGSSALDPIIQKQDQLNQLDSMILMSIMRASSPIMLEPKGAEVEKFTGEPGLVVKWNPLTVQGNAKPEWLIGPGPHASLFKIRELYLMDIEELAGTFDIMKGNKPSGVEAFSALALLDERSKSRFASVFQSRGDAYANNLKVQLELVREFGPDKITEAVLAPNRKYTYQTFLKADLQGSVSVVVENGTQQPKTSLGRRAAIEHLNQLGFINPQDPDQAYKVFQEFGCTYLSPSLDVHVQAAHQKQEAFEQWAEDEGAMMQWAQEQMAVGQQYQMEQDTAQVDHVVGSEGAAAMGGEAPMAPAVEPPPSPLVGTPLEWRGWYSANIHKQEFLKWANGDHIRELIDTKPEIVGLLEGHLMEMDIKLYEEMGGMIGGQPLGDGAAPQPAQQPGKKKQGGNGSAMGNSNTESTQDNEPKGSGQGAQNRGPA